MADSDTDVELSAEALEALHDFYRQEHQKFANELTNFDFDENWQLSQFWYDKQTVNIIANFATKSVNDYEKIALVCCPSLYKKIKETCASNTEVTLFEYDKRFEVIGKDYIFYDYNFPLNLPEQLSKSYNLVIADPPFISEECLKKVASTILFLAKDKIVLCTGDVMENIAKDMLGVVKSSFKPQHTRNLANEIICFTNFSLETFLRESKAS